jgi:hypothetical protein
VAQLDLGRVSEDREKVFVRRSGEDPIYAIRRSDSTGLPIGGWQLRDRQIWSFSTNDVSKLTLRHAGRVLETLRAADGKWTLGPGTTGFTNKFNDLSLDLASESLGRLKAAHLWVDRGPEAPARCGVTTNSLSLEVQLRGEPPRQLRVDFGVTPPGRFPLATTVLDGQPWIFEFPIGVHQLLVLSGLDPAPYAP